MSAYACVSKKTYKPKSRATLPIHPHIFLVKVNQAARHNLQIQLSGNHIEKKNELSVQRKLLIQIVHLPFDYMLRNSVEEFSRLNVIETV